MSTNIDDLMQRTRRYWYEDGLSDLALGGYFLALGLFFLGQSLTPPGSPLWLLWGVGGPLLLICGGVLANWLIKQLKTRLTYPRTGYVNYERPAGGLSGAARLLGVMLLAAIVSAGMVVASGRWTSLTLLFGLVGLGAFGWVSYRLGLRRYLILGLWSLLLGLALVPFALSLEQGGALFWIGFGLGMIVSGLITWRRYNRAAPPPQEASDETTA